MPPGWVHDLIDYWRWLEGVVDQSGGWLDEDYLGVDLVVETDVDPLSPSARPLALSVDRHRMRFPDGSYLSFELSVREDLEQIDYSFHYARMDDMLVWRFDKHPGHEQEDGSDTHVHLGPQDKREPFREVDLSKVLERIRLDQERQSA